MKKNFVKIMTLITVCIITITLLSGCEIKINTEKQEGNNNVYVEQKKENNSISESKKIYDKKSWVFDADYLDNKENKRKESFSSEESIKTPYININSDDAKKINNELKEMCESFYENFGTLAPMKNAITGETSYNESCFNINNLNYKAYEYDNILSIVISYGEFVVPGGIDGVTNKIYCFDLNTLKIMDVNEIIKKGGFNSINDVKIKLKDYLVNNDMPTDLEWDGERCYIDSNGILNVIIPTSSMMSEMSLQLK